MTEFDCSLHHVFDGQTRFLISIPTQPGRYSFSLFPSHVPGGSQDTTSYRKQLTTIHSPGSINLRKKKLQCISLSLADLNNEQTSNINKHYCFNQPAQDIEPTSRESTAKTLKF